jgi:hypothetical protein
VAPKRAKVDRRQLPLGDPRRRAARDDVAWVVDDDDEPELSDPLLDDDPDFETEPFELEPLEVEPLEVEPPVVDPGVEDVLPVESLVVVVVVGVVEAWASDASCATRTATPAPADVISPTVAATRRRVPRCRVEPVAVMN